MTAIEDTIEKLKVLQEVLSDKFSVQREIEDLPRTLATRKELVSRLKKAFVDKNERFEEKRRQVADIRVRLQEAEADREKYESQMDQITTAREYDALEKEIRDASEREQQLRRDLQREEKELQDQRQKLEREEAMIKAEEEELVSEREKIESETANRQEKLQDLEKRETEIIPGLDGELLFKFERIIRSKSGEGIVPIKNGVCTGCQMILPNQFVNDVHMGSDILFCPYCSKIVFYAEHDTAEDDTGFSISDEEGLSDLVEDDFDEDIFDDEDLIEYDEEEVADDEDIVDDEDEDEEEEADSEEDSSDGILGGETGGGSDLLEDEENAIDEENNFDEEDDEEELDQ